MDIASLIEKGMYVLLGVLVTAITNHFLSKSRERQFHRVVSFHAAAEKFRHSFDDILLNIEEGQHAVTWLLGECFLSHKVAMWRFKYFIHGKARMNFLETWGKYNEFYNHNCHKNSDAGLIMKFASASTDYEIQKRKELLLNIEALIKFTV